MFKCMIEAPQVAELIGLGHLVRSKIYAPVDPEDLKGVRTVAGDYNERQLAERMDTNQLVGDIVGHWLRFGERRKTVAFTTSVAHSQHLRNVFLESGVKAEHLDGTTPKAERDEILQRLARGEIEVLCNCMVLTEGWDMPEVSCCILARPTKKMGLYRQMIGRVLRPAEGKTDAIILDHSGAVFRHGFPEDPIEWTLDPDLHAESPTHEARKGVREKTLLECASCDAIRVGGSPCHVCGFFPEHERPKPIVAAEGELGLVEGDAANVIALDPQERLHWHAMLVSIGAERDYKPGWAAVQYKEKFGNWPPRYYGVPEPVEPTPEVLRWVKHKQIRYAKSRQKQQAVAS
jgi:DNA repair protein RadD